MIRTEALKEKLTMKQMLLNEKTKALEEGKDLLQQVLVVVFVVDVVVIVVVVVVVVVVVYLKRLRIVLRCAKAGCGRRTSSS